MVVPLNPSLWEAVAGGSLWGGDQPVLCIEFQASLGCETLPPKVNKNKWWKVLEHLRVIILLSVQGCNLWQLVTLHSLSRNRTTNAGVSFPLLLLDQNPAQEMESLPISINIISLSQAFLWASLIWTVLTEGPFQGRSYISPSWQLRPTITTGLEVSIPVTLFYLMEASGDFRKLYQATLFSNMQKRSVPNLLKTAYISLDTWLPAERVIRLN